MIKNIFAVVIFSIALSSCGVHSTWFSKADKNWKKDNNVPENEKLVQQIYLVGDCGNPNLDTPDPTLELLNRKLSADSVATNGFTNANKMVVFLGDNIYDYGLPDTSDNSYETARARLVKQLDAIKNTGANPLMIPGNHDWHKSKSDGLKWIIREQQFVSEYLQDSLAFLPTQGCPGPIEIKVNNQITMIVIDSEWWLFPGLKPGGAYSVCDISDEYDFLLQFRNTLRRNRGKHIMVVMHHPLISNGNHGGHFSLLDHIFPLTLIKDNYYIPLPIIGSIYPLMRKYGISPEDISSPTFQRLKNGMMAILKDEDKVIMAAGHEHNLQLHSEDQTHYIVSGSGSKSKYLVSGDKAQFLAKEKGFAIVNYYKNGQAWVEFWQAHKDSINGILLFKKPLYAIEPKENNLVSERQIPNYKDSTIVKSIETDYDRKSFLVRALVGETYRAEWSEPVKFKYLDMKSDYGGLTPIKLGGGKQTTSLRCDAGDGNQYTCRSVDKDASSVLPEGFRNTFAKDILQDQISTSHPYGALVIPKLATAVDVFHTDPRILYVPFTPSLGEFIDDMAGKITLVEIRPDENLSEFRQFGRSKNVISTESMIQKLKKDNDNTVDANDYVRARLLDVLIGDWDRHEDQWRWAEFDNKDKGTVFRPVPRDRDQVFVQYEGVLSKIISSRFYQRLLTHFDYEIVDLIGLMQQAIHLDKFVLGRLEQKDWIKTAEKMQIDLSDEVISEAVHQMPPEIFAISGDEIIAKLKQRRDDLVKYAKEYYKFLAAEVDVVLTDKNEYIKVNRLENGDTEIKVYKRTFQDLKNGEEKDKIEQEIYSRYFKRSETKEIRIYTLDGKDSIVITGKAHKAIYTRIIGGNDQDYFSNTSKIRSIKQNTKYYDYDADKKNKNIYAATEETRMRIVKSPNIIAYNYKEFKHNTTKPMLFFQFDPDFGFSPGLGILYTKNGFRRSPYQAQYLLRGNKSTTTSAYNLEGYADYPSAFNDLTGLNIAVKLDGPDYVRNYFGQGNNSVDPGKDADIRNFRIGLNYYAFSVGMTKRKNDNVYFRFGPLYDFAEVTRTADSIFNSFGQNEFMVGKTYNFLGAFTEFNLDYTNRKLAPTRGVKFKTDIAYRNSIDSDPYSFVKTRADLVFYTTPVWRSNITFALRLGGEMNFGDLPFYHQAYLGGVTNLRGYRRDRFTGRHSFYQSIEVRAPLFKIQNYLVNGQWGIFGFLDNGAVFDNTIPNLKKFHSGYGGGLWLNFYNAFVISGGLGYSAEGAFLRITSNFFF